jgi:MinD superfamily P-loop ATPase
VRTVVCVNKYDLNPQQAEAIASQASERGAQVIGNVRYDPAVTRAQMQNTTVVEYARDGVSEDIRLLWNRVKTELLNTGVVSHG